MLYDTNKAQKIILGLIALLNALNLSSETALLLWQHAVNPSLGLNEKVPFSDGRQRKSAV